MFAKIVVLALALASGVYSAPAAASPVDARGDKVVSVSSDYGHAGFSNWGGISSLHGFDDFYGSDDFAHYRHFSPVVVRESRPELVCHSQQVVIVQQRLAVLQEMAKRIITETICEVETQTIVFQQHHAALGRFSHDLRRLSGHRVGYDGKIAAHFEDFYNSDGTLSTWDFGFSGKDIGSNYYVPTSNWDEKESPSKVGSAYQAAQIASFA
ncbi:Amidohydro-rel domain-containing protein [Mycena kentingensis (nom. inval.)]|nr:Amidohydro-rel domain-containing protein [Mycena kentingensis (nom. inval.)]